MTPEEIEGNIICAGYMDLHKEGERWSYYTEYPNPILKYKNEELKYSSSPDWIVPAAIKIGKELHKEIEKASVYTKRLKNYLTHLENIKNHMNIFNVNDVEKLFNYTVDAIKLFNKK